MTDRLKSEDLQIEERADTPFYQLLYESLLRKIRDVRYLPGAALPSERALSEYLQVNRETVRRAYSLLLEMQVVQRHGNRKLVLCEDARFKALGPFPTVAVILPMKFSLFVELNHQGFLQYLKGIMEAAVRCRCSITMLELPAADSSEKEVEQFLKMLSAGNMAGVIHLGNRYSVKDAPLAALLQHTGILQVCISGSADSPHAASIVEDSSRSLKKLFGMLQASGLKRISFLDAFSAEDREENRQFLFHYHARWQLPEMAFRFRKEGFISPEEWYLDGGMERSDLQERLVQLAAAADGPQVLICSNPELAETAEQILQEGGCGPLPVLSCNLTEGTKQRGFVHPFYQIGKEAVEYLFHCCRTGEIVPDKVIRISSKLNFDSI